MFFAAFVLSLIAHESTHYVILRRGGAHPRSMLRYKPWLGVISLGLGWAYDPRAVSQAVRLQSYQLANIVGLGVWVVGALANPSMGVFYLGAGVIMLVSNWYFPRTDGWNYRRIRREACKQASVAGGSPSTPL